ncbi:MAG: tRNA preQ1(34) S-adenosylmethionine ribosyltransferase-isomerase QueA, partial [Acidobacteriota bacterium]|nr:tRNA preQ1(34) S-adenosylmethionine ribosyltransferase-isomerase QueA [Acidobacteriota bacterium]
VEILLVEKVGERTWQALLKPARRLRKGERLVLEPGLEGSLAEDPVDGRATLDLTRPAEEFLPRLGHVPLPPYIHRADNTHDRERYQTVYASEPGAIAAPTAGLHFGDEDLEALRAAGVEIVEITLHVGIGTFRPVSVDEVAAHVMDAERYRIDGAAANAIEAARSTGRRIVAVGTTVVRTLESVLREGGPLRACEGRTDLFIYPGFEFRVVDVLLTNFHLPRSTLLMLVSAFAGTDRVLDAYSEAIRERYRFYSYGDAMLLTRAP